MGLETRQCLLPQLFPLKGGEGQGRSGPCGEVACFKFARDWVLEGTQGGDPGRGPREGGGAGGSELTSGTAWGEAWGAGAWRPA